MTDRFIDNFTPGDGTDGLTWAKAELTAAAVDAADAAGDRWVFDYRHAESTAGAVTLAGAGTLAAPSQLLSVTQSGAAGISALTAGASIAATGTNAITVSGCLYAYGLSLSSGSGAGAASMLLASVDNDAQTYEACTLTVGNTSTSSRMRLGTTGGSTESSVNLIGCTLSFSSTGQGVWIGNCKVRIRGGALAGSAITTFVATAPLQGIDLVADGFDFSAGAAGLVLIAASAASCGNAVFRNCKMPASWSGTLLGGAPANMAFRAEMWNCQSATASDENNYAMWVEDYAGSIKHETTIVRTGGANDGVNGMSWKMTTSANAEFPSVVLRSPEIFVPITSTGAKTLTVHIVSDENVAAGQGAGTGNAWQDNEWWLEVQVLGTTDSPQATIVSGAPTVIATATDHAASTETWTTTGMTTPQKQKLTLSVTANEKCTLGVTVCGAKASGKLIYVCPKVVVS